MKLTQSNNGFFGQNILVKFEALLRVNEITFHVEVLARTNSYVADGFKNTLYIISDATP